MTPILMNNDFVPEIADEEESKLLMELLKDARN
jgi:hypothetical protein